MSVQKPGRLVPAPVAAGRSGARDLAHRERLTPVLDDQPPARGGVVREGDVARRPHALGRGLHPRVHDDAALVDLEPGRLGEIDPRGDSRGHEDEVALGGVGILDLDPVPCQRRHLRTGPQPDAVVAQPAGDALARVRAQPVLLRTLLEGHQGDVQSLAGQ